MKKQKWDVFGTSWMPALASASRAVSEVGSTVRPGSLHMFSGGDDANDDGKRTVRARRRRRSEPAGPEGRERAEAPRRRRSDQREETQPSRAADRTATSTPSTGSSRLRRRPTGRGRPGGGGSRLLPLGLLVFAGICIFSVMLLMGPDDSGNVAFDLPAPTIDTDDTGVPAQPTASPAPFTPPAALSDSDGETWLVMLYQDADDKILEQDILVDLNEAERVGSSDRVHMVAQIDRYRAGYRGDGDWASAKRFYITQGDDLQRVQSQEVADLGEVNMSDGETLVDFVSWAIETFPADKHALILSDHGMGWPGGWSDAAPGGRGDPNIPLSAALGDELFLMELDQALEETRARTGLDKFELIGLDACLMGHLEVFSALAPHARYAVASQETEPALGWAYTSFLDTLVDKPEMDGAELGRHIVKSYVQDDQRIVDEQARAELLRQGTPMGGLAGLFGGVSAQQLAQQMEQSITLTAVDLGAVAELVNGLNDLAFTLQDVRQEDVARARNYAQSFTSVFGRNVPASYIDLGSFVQLLKRETGDRTVGQAVDRVLSGIDKAIIAERHGPSKSGATGISIYFPNSKLYASPVTGPQSYTEIARRFAQESLWDDFQAYHYTGRRFESAAQTVAVPEAVQAADAPGSGPIALSPITLSGDTAAPGQPVLLSTDISGEKIGYVYLFAGFYDADSNSIFVADRDYLESLDTREIDSVYYPDWGEGEFTMEFEWEPLMFAIDDGVNSAVALFTPQTYGASPEEATYTVDGIYTYADDGESRYARLYFRDGVLQQVFGFTGQGGTGAPREIIPQSGDTFTVLDKWLDLDDKGRVAQLATQEGETLTFGEQMFTWKELDAAAGQYIVGFSVEDLDGNAQEVYTQVAVQ
ncbi:clostripain-related cysteine peptidase [Chloroflexota bacterium]